MNISIAHPPVPILIVAIIMTGLASVMQAQTTHSVDYAHRSKGARAATARKALRSICDVVPLDTSHIHGINCISRRSRRPETELREIAPDTLAANDTMVPNYAPELETSAISPFSSSPPAPILLTCGGTRDPLNQGDITIPLVCPVDSVPLYVEVVACGYSADYPESCWITPLGPTIDEIIGGHSTDATRVHTPVEVAQPSIR